MKVVLQVDALEMQAPFRISGRCVTDSSVFPVTLEDRRRVGGTQSPGRQQRLVGSMTGSSWAMAQAHIVGQHGDAVDVDGPLMLKHDRVPGVCFEDGDVHCDDAVWGGR